MFTEKYSIKERRSVMRIVAINGSPRKDGNCTQIINVVRKAVEEAGVEFRELQPGANVHPCLACYKCIDDSEHKCVQNDCVNEIIRECREADGILLVSPVYHGGIAGNMKCVIDRLMLAGGCGPENIFAHKVGGALCTLRRTGGSATYHELLAAMDAMEMIIMTSDYWGAVHGAEKGECMEDYEGLEVAERLGKNMAWMVRVLAQTRDTIPAPEAYPRKMMNFIR